MTDTDKLQKLENISKLKAKLDSYRPLSKGIVKHIHDNLVLNWTYHPNAK